MAIALQVGGVNFGTKLELTAHVRELIAQYPVGSRVSDEHKIFLESLFQFHPDAENKLRGGVSDIEVRLDIYGNKHFFAYDHHGNGEDVSWTKCVKNAKAK